MRLPQPSRHARIPRLFSLLGLAAALLAAPAALAYELKHTPSGQIVRWTTPSVSFVVDPGVEAAVPGGAAAVDAAVRGWSGVGGAPVLATTAGPGGAKPALDGQNSVVFMPHGFAPAGNALAVTISSTEDATGALLDTDIVINGIHSFSVMAGSAREAHGLAVSTDGAQEGEVEGAFDVEHVVSHEVGHAMGLGDVHDDQGAVMFAMTTPGSAANRAPSSDDIGGLDAAYAGLSSRAGCGQSSVSAVRPRSSDLALFALALGLGAVRFGARRRSRVATALLVVLVGALASPDPARASGSQGRVAHVETVEVGGMLQTRIELAATSCASDCPVVARATVWGGRRDGVTQRVGGVAPPAVGDVVELPR